MLFLSLSPRIAVRTSIRQSLSPHIRLSIATGELERQRELINAIYGERFAPQATCRKCAHRLTDMEIMLGFTDNPKDYSTACPKCQTRFNPRLHRSTDTTHIDVSFFCPAQTLDQLTDLTEATLDDFKTKYAGVYYSAIAHFGGLQQAFKLINATYAYAEELEWKTKVKNFLGKLPDRMIARLVGTTPRQIRSLRNKQDIKAYNRRDFAEAEED